MMRRSTSKHTYVLHARAEELERTTEFVHFWRLCHEYAVVVVLVVAQEINKVSLLLRKVLYCQICLFLAMGLARGAGCSLAASTALAAIARRID